MKLIETRVFEFDESELKELFKEGHANLDKDDIETKFKNNNYLIDWLLDNFDIDDFGMYDYCNNEKHGFLLDR